MLPMLQVGMNEPMVVLRGSRRRAQLPAWLERKRPKVRDEDLTGLKYFDKLQPLLRRLHDVGCAGHPDNRTPDRVLYAIVQEVICPPIAVLRKSRKALYFMAQSRSKKKATMPTTNNVERLARRIRIAATCLRWLAVVVACGSILAFAGVRLYMYLKWRI